MTRPSDIAMVLFEPQEPDDQDSPDVHIEPLSAEELRSALALLLESGPGIDAEDYIWIKETDEDRLLREVEDPVGLLFSGQAESFYCRFRGLRAAGHRLPMIGALFYIEDGSGALALNYYVNERWNEDVEWTPDAVDAFFSLLRELQSADAEVRYYPDAFATQPHRDALFQQAFEVADT